jgi:hypothetical protein
MSLEFIRGPNVYYRETIPSDLEDVKNALVDWEQFPLSLDRTKNYLKGLLFGLRYIERPYSDTIQCREILTACKVSDDSFIGVTQYTVYPGKIVDILLNAGLPSIRGTGLMNEAALLRDAAILTELGCTSYTTKLDAKFIPNLRPYQTLESTDFSSRVDRDLRTVKVIKSDYDIWRANNSTSIPSYTYSGNDYVAPHLRD